MAQPDLLRLVPQAPQALRDILDRTLGPLQPPIRSEIFGLQRFAQHGRSLGETHRAARARPGGATFVPRLQNNIQILRLAHRYIGQQARTGYDISPAAEWLLDNFHVIEGQLKEIQEGLPRSYYRALPVLLDEPLAGLPRIYGVAWAFVAHTDGAFNEELLVSFLDAYQQTRALNLNEMWALPTTLRVVLVENLRRLAERVATHKAAREVANLCCDHIASYPPSSLDAVLQLLEQRGVGQVFLAQMAQRLQAPVTRTTSDNPTVQELWLSQAMPAASALQMQQAADQAADNLSVSNAVTALRAIGDADWPGIIARSSTLMQHMLASPVFEAEDTATRDQTLHAIERLARRSGHSEVFVAETLLARMRADNTTQPGAVVPIYWLHGAGRPALLQALGLQTPLPDIILGWGRRAVLPAYLGALLLGTLGLVAWMLVHHAAAGWAAVFAVALMLFPASEVAVALINRLISESAKPRHLPRLALANGIPAEHRVIVVVPAMLTDAAAVTALVHRLQLHYLANPESNAQFALLSDWGDADTAHASSDKDLLDSAVEQIRALDLRYAPDAGTPAAEAHTPRFIVLHRERSFSQSEQRWIGWERKRGKLEQLVTALAQGPSNASNAFLDLGEASRIAPDTRYIVTLDSDTQLPPGRLRELVGVAAHPHNQPVLDASGNRVVQGYGILQPRILTPLPAPRDFTLYHWLFAGQCGIDPYSAATSEVYQDLFSEGSFSGKGLLNVGAMHAVLSGRLPQDHVLSHDLLEGSMVRCAAVTDITVVEDAPFHADVAASRIHRWTRGDWQLLPFLLQPRRYGLRAIHCWKLFDNLRRSLVAPMSLLLIVWTMTGSLLSPWSALALVAAAFTAGPLMGAIAGFSPSRDDVARQHFYSQALSDLARAVWSGLWHMAQLLQQALLSADAIVRALYRMGVSHRHLLQWTTAAAAQASAKTGFAALARRHWLKPVIAGLLWGGLLLLGAPYPLLASLLCLVWAASPVWTWWVSRPSPTRQSADLSASDQAYLEGIARDTWRLFERCVVVGDKHLPPDNLQTTPHDMVAHRTSPTNIGLYLLSTACARQFGWIGTQELLSRLEATHATLTGLQRHRGHFMNWYDTQTGAPLLPLYVSTVDSGNLSGHLLAVAQACQELAQAPFDASATQRALAASRQRLAPLLAARTQLTPALRESLRWCLADHRATVSSAQLDIQAEASGELAVTVQRLHALAQNFEELAWAADYSFLYNRKRHLFHIGYRVAEQQRDAGFYDLLASESRLTSLLAIAKGDVPVRHWATLGRPFYAVGAVAGLRSWSGSMFEYLMPMLVLNEPHGSVLRDACRAALREQMAFAATQDVPWGISESAYAAADHTLAYQYAPQGVPRLALRRTPPDELVIAPYATALAAQISSHRAVANFSRLEALVPRARYGIVEALDFSPARQVSGEIFTPVNTFMAHHQGMGIVAIANVLLDGPAQRWGMAHPRIEAVASLLHERAPREVSLLSSPTTALPPMAVQQRAPGLLREVVPGTGAVEPTHLLSNGRYNVALRPNGAGWSRWGQTGITRWRDDALRDSFGSFFYVRSAHQPHPVSITQHPAPDPAAHYHSTYHADRVCFDAAWPHLQAHTTVWVSPEDDIEFRQVELRNISDQPLDIELLSAFDVTLSDPRADEAHPAFTNLFVKAQWLASHEALVFERQPRLPTEQALQAAHFLADHDPQIVAVRSQTDRQQWLGRNRDTGQPQAVLVPTPSNASDSLAGQGIALDTGLNPVCVLSITLRIAPRGKARLTFATAASDNPGTLRAVIDKYRQHSHVQRASLMSATLAGIRLRTLGMGSESFAGIQLLGSALGMSLTRPRAGPAGGQELPAYVCDRRLLWRFGISGDRPVILVFAGVSQGLGMLRTLSQALRVWSWGGLACDFVVVNNEPTSYLMELNRDIAALRERHASDSHAEPGAATTGFYLLRAEELSKDELSTLQCLARVRLHADGRPLLHHIQEWAQLHEHAMEERNLVSTTAVPGCKAALATSVGEFAAESGEFRFDAGSSTRPARPWINVLSNPSFGAQLSEAAGGYTWAVNSRLNQLTAWSNDPVTDQPSEWFLLQDRRTRQTWSVAPSVWGSLEDGHASYRVAHGQGYSTISHRHGDLEVMATWCVDVKTSVKHIRLRFVNRGHTAQHLRVTGIAEWMMGANRSDRGTTHTAVHHQRLPPSQAPGTDVPAAGDHRVTALLCTQNDRSAGFGHGTAFLALAGTAEETDDWTCDRRECFDARGRLVVPDHWGQKSGGGLDPCAALSTLVSVAAGETLERVFLLGYGESPEAAKQIVVKAAATSARQRMEAVRSHWDTLLGATTVATPDPLFDAMVNRWLLYQTVTCRMWAKAGFYQAGGATGFRDQLQDAMALAWAAPEMLRAQIVLCASRQFAEGDVQHWWHAPTGAGVRTHFSDDLLWLAYALHHYLQATGDHTLLDQQVPFLEGAAIPDGAEDAYYTPQTSHQTATVYEHAARAIDRSLRTGIHGLPLMGTGDWNDGMNRVGHEGRGESVWLGWFLCRLVADFAPVARDRGETDRAQRWEQAAQGWTQALDGDAWDGQWFKRAFFDNGQPLGSHTNTEARIDLIAQTWGVLSGATTSTRQDAAMEAVEAHLVDHAAGLIHLLDPPFAHAEPSAGYIQAYPPGVRENGGQYSHAGVWALMAQARQARARPTPSAKDDLAYRYFTYLSPAHRSRHATHGAAYLLEPYAMAGDVYTQPPYVGRGGWSWYTGAAAWMHRAGIESIFGLQQDAKTLCFTPCLPSHWARAELTLRRDGRSMRFILLRSTAEAALEATAALDCRLLRPGDTLDWHGLRPLTAFVIPLESSAATSYPEQPNM